MVSSKFLYAEKKGNDFCMGMLLTTCRIIQLVLNCSRRRKTQYDLFSVLDAFKWVSSDSIFHYLQSYIHESKI
jgi:hypothetical protein